MTYLYIRFISDYYAPHLINVLSFWVHNNLRNSVSLGPKILGDSTFHPIMFVLYDELSAILSYLLCKPSRDRHSAFQNRLFVKSFWTSWPPRSWPRPTSYYYSPCWQNWETLGGLRMFERTVCWGKFKRFVKFRPKDNLP